MGHERLMLMDDKIGNKIKQNTSKKEKRFDMHDVLLAWRSLAALKPNGQYDWVTYLIVATGSSQEPVGNQLAPILHYPLSPKVFELFCRESSLHGCQAHQRDVGQQHVQTFWRHLFITFRHTVILKKCRKAGNESERNTDGVYGREDGGKNTGRKIIDLNASECSYNCMLNTDVF